MERTERAERAFSAAIFLASSEHKEFVTPEHLLWGIFMQDEGQKILASYQSSWESLSKDLTEQYDKMDSEEDVEGNYELMTSSQFSYVISWSEAFAQGSGHDTTDIPHMLEAILHLEDSMACYLLMKHTTTDKTELLATIVSAYNGYELPLHTPEEEDIDDDWFDDIDMDDDPFITPNREEEENAKSWRRLVTCINDNMEGRNPLIGRELELDRTIQVLCRKDKNNPLHIGEPGVGKTALIYGLAARIIAGDVPERLQGARIYQMDMGSMVAGATYRGDFEKRIKAVMEGVESEGNAIVYIDEIHTLVGSGTAEGSSLDGSNMLKPYLEGGKIRFIGSTTYQEYNRYFQKSKGLVRRFQQIDIPEPTVEEATKILEGLLKQYESHHGVTYAEGVLAYAAEASAKYISDRFLPDKAIDLIDEAGAFRVMHPTMRKYRGAMKKATKQVVDQQLINDVLARICKIDPKSLHDDDTQGLERLSSRLKSQIYGQDTAVQKVVEAVEMGKAGLLDDNKPIASLLFVGPTGVGKTEVCKVLAQELGIELVRFDMSEYTEKHTVAKLIGSPAGYIGYDDGGLLTDAIRKTPHCVLLLDEIEKAHADIYNILLQVMDYARLTDNKGQKADFRHVILVMTSNAGAQFAHQAAVGFGSTVSAGEAMLATVKKTFKPEFLARLSDTIVFNDMDETMAGLILDKKLRQLSRRLAARHVTLSLTDEARAFLLKKGFTRKLGAREMDRQLNQHLTPLLTRAILYGALKNGGHACIAMPDAANATDAATTAATGATLTLTVTPQ